MIPVYTLTDFQRAATAAGYEFVIYDGNCCLVEVDGSVTQWRPLSTDTHAMRLAIDANIDILLCNIKQQVICVSNMGDHGPFPYRMDKYQAVRSAIFIAAAALGAKLLAEKAGQAEAAGA